MQGSSAVRHHHTNSIPCLPERVGPRVPRLMRQAQQASIRCFSRPQSLNPHVLVEIRLAKSQGCSSNNAKRKRCTKFDVLLYFQYIDKYLAIHETVSMNFMIFFKYLAIVSIL